MEGSRGLPRQGAGRLSSLLHNSPSFATGAVDSPSRLIKRRPVSKGLHYKEGREGRGSSERWDVILGGLWAGSSRASCPMRSFWTLLGEVYLQKISQRPSVVGKWTSSI